MSNNQFPFGPPHPADIILTRTTGVSALANLVGQTIVTFKKSRFTHVAVCVASGTLLDAQPRQGVRLRNVAHEVIAGRLTSAMIAKGHLKVLRHKSIADDADAEAAHAKMFDVFEKAGPQLQKKYNMWMLLPNRSDSDSRTKRAAQAAFCSELVVLVLRSLEMLPPKFPRPSGVFPVHFQRLETKEGWVDVTGAVSGWLESTERSARSSDMEEARTLAEEMARYNLSLLGVPSFHQFTVASAVLDGVLSDVKETFRGG